MGSRPLRTLAAFGLGRLTTTILLLALPSVGGCRSSPATVDDASDATASNDVSTLRDATASRDAIGRLDANDAAVSDGPAPEAGTTYCTGVPCVIGQQYCYTFLDYRADAATVTYSCVPIPADCALADADTACQCVYDVIQCQGHYGCSFQSGAVIQVLCEQPY